MPHNRDMNNNWSEALANSANAASALMGRGRTDYTADEFPLDRRVWTAADEFEGRDESFDAGLSDHLSDKDAERLEP